VDKARVSIEEAHIETPMLESKGPATLAPPKPVQSQNPEHVVTGETISGSNGTPGLGSQAGDQISVAEAARRAREKKEAAK